MNDLEWMAKYISYIRRRAILYNLCPVCGSPTDLMFEWGGWKRRCLTCGTLLDSKTLVPIDERFDQDEALS